MTNVLLITPNFFGYDEVIKDELVALGYRVHLHSDRPSESSFVKAMIRVDYRLMGFSVGRYYRAILDQYEEDYFNKIIIVRGEAVSSDWLQFAKKKHPKAELVLYLWDSIAYNHNVKSVWHLFDRVLSFDRDDCEKYGFIYRPLFAPDVYFRARGTAKQYDLIFVGTVYADRHIILNEVIEDAKSKSLALYLHAYYPSKFFAVLRGFVDPSFRRFYKNYVTHEKLTQVQTASLIAASRAVLDVNRVSQKGLTMRTIEAMAAGVKIITTNVALREAVEFDPSLHFIISRDAPRVDRSFIYSDCIENVDLDCYSIRAWVLDVLGDS